MRIAGRHFSVNRSTGSDVWCGGEGELQQLSLRYIHLLRLSGLNGGCHLWIFCLSSSSPQEVPARGPTKCPSHRVISPDCLQSAKCCISDCREDECSPAGRWRATAGSSPNTGLSSSRFQNRDNRSRTVHRIGLRLGTDPEL